MNDSDNNNINEFISFVSGIKSADTSKTKATVKISLCKKPKSEKNPLANRGFTEIPRITMIKTEVE